VPRARCQAAVQNNTRRILHQLRTSPEHTRIHPHAATTDRSSHGVYVKNRRTDIHDGVILKPHERSITHLRHALDPTKHIPNHDIVSPTTGRNRAERALSLIRKNITLDMGIGFQSDGIAATAGRAEHVVLDNNHRTFSSTVTPDMFTGIRPGNGLPDILKLTVAHHQ